MNDMEAKPTGAKRKHVAICIPSTDVWKAKMAASLAGMMCTSLPYVDMGLSCDDVTGAISDKRNRLVQVSLNAGVSHILFVDTDMVFPANALLRLLQHEKDIVGPFYARKVAPHHAAGALEADYTVDHFKDGLKGLARAAVLPAGFMLIRSEVFRHIDPPWFFETFEPENKADVNPFGLVTEDTNFLRKARAAGYQPWVDLNLTFEMGHIGDQVCVLEQKVTTYSSQSAPEEATNAAA